MQTTLPKQTRRFTDLTGTDMLLIFLSIWSLTLPTGPAFLLLFMMGWGYFTVFKTRNSRLTHQLLGQRQRAKHEPALADQLARFDALSKKKKRHLTVDEKNEKNRLKNVLLQSSVKPLLPLYSLRLDLSAFLFSVIYHCIRVCVLFPEAYDKLFNRVPNLHLIDWLFN